MGNIVANQMVNGIKFSGPVSHVIKNFCSEMFKSITDQTHTVLFMDLNCIGDFC
jgi:hypothetical protein